MPLAATTTKLHITSNAASPTTGAPKDGKASKNERDPLQEQRLQNHSHTAPEAEKFEDATPPNTSKSRDTRPESRNQISEVPKAVNESASWLNWFSKPEIATWDETGITQPDGDASSTGKDRPQSTIAEALQGGSTHHEQRQSPDPNPISPILQQGEVPRSWLSLWGNASKQTKSSPCASAIGVASYPQNDSDGTGSQTGKVSDVLPDPVSTSQPSQQSMDGGKPSYGWAFWSRDQPQSDDEKTRSGIEVGGISPAGSSKSEPQTAIVDEARGVLNKVGKRQRPQSLEVGEDPKKPRSTENNAKKDSKPEAVHLAPPIKPKVDASSKAKRIAENLILPSFRSTYSTVGRPSLMQQISMLLQLGTRSEPKHVDIVQSPPRVKRALAIVSLARCVEHGSHLHG